jgi:hypothetical protein
LVSKGEKKDQESIGRRLGATRVWRERIHEGKNASKRMKLVVGSGPAVGGPGRPECRLSGLYEREFIVTRGSLATAPLVRSGSWRKRGVIRPLATHFSHGWITAGKLVSLRGCHDLREGKTLKGVVHKRLRREIKPWNSNLLGKPLRG